MIIDAGFSFGLPTLTNSTARTVSPNVYDAGSAKKLFDGPGGDLKLIWKAVPTADDNPTVRVELVGADNAALDSNPITLADSGTVVYGADGSTAIASGAVVEGELRPSRQFAAKRYYGLFVTLGGTNPDLVAATCKAELVRDSQSNMNGARAATPA
jgi:hypothetical protein